MPTPASRTDDVLHRFLIDQTDMRGALVHLGPSWRSIRASTDYPDAVARLLGEAVAATALLGGHTKVEGNLSLHLKGDQSLRRIFAEYRHPGVLRGLAHWQESLPADLGLRDLGSGAVLALTMETPTLGSGEMQRYQGLIGVDADNLAGACEQYFAQSEQLPTRLLLAVNDDTAAGLLLQALPGATPDAAQWQHLGMLLQTVSPAELLETPAQTLLWRLFHQHGVRLLSEQSLRFGCSCSRERVAQMLRSLGETEAMAALQGDYASIICEFCGQHYRFDRIDLAALFAAPAPPSSRVQQ